MANNMIIENVLIIIAATPKTVTCLRIIKATVLRQAIMAAASIKLNLLFLTNTKTIYRVKLSIAMAMGNGTIIPRFAQNFGHFLLLLYTFIPAFAIEMCNIFTKKDA